LAQIALSGASAPCPVLDVREDFALCKLVIAEAGARMEPVLANSLRVGCGCSMPDVETTDAQVEEFDQVSLIKIYCRACKVVEDEKIARRGVSRPLN